MIASTLVLTAALLGWKADIESKSGLPLLVAEVQHDAARNVLLLPPDTPERDLFTGYLEQEAFVKQFMQMYAVMIHHKGPGREAYLVMVNGARRAEWAGFEEAVLAHEFGHAWIKAQGYPTPVFVPNNWACVGIHTGDITQHVLIRAECERRGIDNKGFWRKTLEASVEQMEKAGPPPETDRCARVRQAALLVDVRLGWKPGEWPGQARYEAAVAKAMPEVEGTAGEILDYLKAHDMTDRDQHREALKFVFEKLRDLGYGKTKDYRVYATLEEYSHVS